MRLRDGRRRCRSTSLRSWSSVTCKSVTVVVPVYNYVSVRHPGTLFHDGRVGLSPKIPVSKDGWCSLGPTSFGRVRQKVFVTGRWQPSTYAHPQTLTSDFTLLLSEPLAVQGQAEWHKGRLSDTGVG